MAAGYILDHVMDGELPQGRNAGVETALGTTILLIAEAALEETGASLQPEHRGELLHQVKRLLINSCSGQLSELRLAEVGGPVDYSVDDALTLTESKAGSLRQMAVDWYSFGAWRSLSVRID